MDNAFSTGALRAYKIGQSVTAPSSVPTQTPTGPSFAEVLENTVRDTVETVRAGDRAAVAGLQGKLSTQEVVEATMAMETAIETAVAVRDKVVGAYQEVLRMTV
ncbi:MULTISPECIES: flagellar hook-basal body complex protein FliE [Rhodobacterales]|uniref:flagellar hook-basal body complex protein FliE n=1 Tax=Roseobacter sp. N2S TaxID=2663844 RepID=UPI0028647F0E|nr:MULTISPECIES: flagellar hook-basal body complex protein FliE [Rhodobacterales]MDR6266740.1 flagellar hook-basal body complex protein FliE [Roseobacter sp. N2S]